MTIGRSLLVAAVGLAITVAGTLVVRWDTANDVQQRLEERADRITAVITLELERYSSASRAVAALRADDPTLEQWVVRVERLGIAADLVSVFSVASATVDGQRPDRRLVIDLVAPVAPNEAALGLDVLSVPDAAPAARRALDDEQVSLSEALTLVQEPGDQTGLVVYAPWYAEDGSVGGVTDLVVRGQDLLEALRPELGEVGVALVDVATSDGPHEIGRLEPSAGLDDGLSAVRRVEVLGQTWDVEVTASSGFVSAAERRSALLVLIGLLSVTALVTALVHVLQRREEHARVEVEERTADLVAANADLASALRAKDEFLAVVTHEFRTPITVIRGFAHTAATASGAVPDDVRHALARIDQHARRLHVLVENALTTAQLRSGDLAVLPEVVQVEQLVRSVAAQHEHLAPFTVDVEPGLLAAADPTYVVRALEALLSNVDKYGRPPVAVTARGEDGEVVMTVSDAGDGVPPDVRQRVFEPFEQADHGDTRRSRGVGLGLAVVRELCERMGGTVELVDTPRGACFEIRLLRADPAPSVASPATTEDEG